MKKSFLLFLLFTSFCFSQSITERYNSLTRRYEYFNTSNQMIGYKQYNSLTRAWEYYDTTPQPKREIKDENFDLWASVAVQKQQRYNYNKNRIDQVLNSIWSDIDKLGTKRSRRIKLSFSSQYSSYLKTANLDYSNDANADRTINWIFETMSEILEDTE